METLSLPAQLKSLEPFRAFVNGSALNQGVGEEFIPKIELVLEEILTNQVFHAYREESGNVKIACSLEENTFCIQFEDEGPPFNPLKQPSPKLNDRLEDRKIGGLGIHLVKNMADHLDYQRKENRNILTVCFKVKD